MMMNTDEMLHIREPLAQPLFLPRTQKEAYNILGWKEIDILLLSGDAYIDSPASATALLGRFLILHGYRVGVLTQPRWDTLDDFTAFEAPKLCVGITAGSIDSMLAHYTAFRKKRSEDSYTAGGKAGNRPNRASIVYTNLVKRAYPSVPIILGGVEASLRMTTHYDFWENALRRPLLCDAKADVLVYGMGERPLLHIMRYLDFIRNIEGVSLSRSKVLLQEYARIIGGCVTVSSAVLGDTPYTALPSHEKLLAEKDALLDLTKQIEVHCNQYTLPAVQYLDELCKRYIYISPPSEMLSTAEMDSVYALPYTRKAHPSYSAPIPALTVVEHSITTHRGCAGGCSFCAISIVQGRKIASRSEESILSEIKVLSKEKSWNGVLTDVGGPSANMWGGKCTKKEQCYRLSCLHPKRCKHFEVDQEAIVKMLHTISELDTVRHVRVASGVRYEMLLEEPEAFKAYTQEFTGGQLKIAPEHINSKVLYAMRKPPAELFENFVSQFYQSSKEVGKEQYVIPYLISAFPTCTKEDMKELARWLKKRSWSPKQVQCFVPTPSTMATAMFYTQKNEKKEAIYVATTDKERLEQHHILLGVQDLRK